ncbi:MAG: diguanylate cyclase (GGDEF)-like protein [Paraglaciecola sp.]
MRAVFLSLVIALAFIHLNSQADTKEIDTFIQGVDVKTYDCPNSDMVPELDSMLQDTSLPIQQTFRLSVLKAHWLICVGKYKQGTELLQSFINNDELDTSSRAYASATYQIGFILDVQEQPQRCDYYREAELLAKDRFNDIHLSAQLGQITVCNSDGTDMGKKLGKLFILLEEFTNKKDKPAIAHIHNNIGLLYGGIGQNALAAEAYEKAYLIGLDVYEKKNQIAPLMSLITALMGTGNFEKANLMIEQLRLANLKVNTPLSNIWLQFAKAQYSYRTENFEELRASLWKWKVFQKEVSNEQMDGLYSWYSAAMCLHDEDKECLRLYLESIAKDDSGRKTQISANRNYLSFLVEANLFLEDIPAIQTSFRRFSDVIMEKVFSQQESGKILGVAKLHSELLTLEANLVIAKKQQVKSMVLIALIIIALLTILYFVFGRRFLRKISTDPLTGLRNESSALAKIKRIARPSEGKANVLALFDVKNFTEVSNEIGHMTGKLALKSVANCLKQATREQDVVGRVGGDQFIVCSINIEDVIAKALFERVQRTLADMAFNAGTGDRINIDSTMSIYSSTDKFDDLDEVLNDMRDSLRKRDKIKDA